MRRSIFLAVFFFFLLAPPAAFSFDGPLMVRNQFPLFLPVDTPVLESALPENSLTVGLSYSSVFMLKNSTNWSVNLDMETAELDFIYRRLVGNFIELGLEVPVLSYDSGVLDGFLDSYHRTFGFPDYGRSSRPKNEFLFEVRRDGKVVLQGEGGGIGIGDIRFTAKKLLLAGDPAVSIEGELELPTGSASKGYGSGGIDSGVSLLADKRLGERFNSYFNFGVVFPGDLRWQERIDLKTFIHGGAAVEAAIWDKVSLLGQVMFQGSPLPRTGIGTVDRAAVLLTFGARCSLGKDMLEFSLTEDPNTAGAPDFQVNATYRKKF